ncbi:MAG: response regulator transcription factor [Rhodothermales bacterium]
MKKDIYIVDDHPLMRRGYAYLLNGEDDLQIVGEAGSAEEAFPEIRALKPDLVITDVSLEGMNGIELTKRLQTERPDLPVLIVSMHDETLYAERALRAGARGFIMKREVDDVIVSAIRRVLSGGLFLSETMSTRMLLRFSRRGLRPEVATIDSLSDRELEVFEMFGRGYSTREVAGALHISPKTVESHRGRIKEKLAIQSTAELVKRSVLWVQNRQV